MTNKEMWQLAYLIAIARGHSSNTARDMANQAVTDWEEFEEDTD